MIKKSHKFIKLALLINLFAALFFVYSCSFNIPSDSKVYIVGIGLNYNSKYRLSGPINDVSEFCTYYKYILDKKGVSNEVFYMLHMIDPQTGNDYTNWNSEYAPSKANIKRLLNSFAYGSEAHKKITQKDLLVIYYSGHGNESTSIDEEESGAMCLMSYEGQTEPELYTHKELTEDLKKIEGTVVVISDSCFSGHLAGEVSDLGSEIYKGNAYNDFGKKGGYSMNFGTLKLVSGIHVLSASQACDVSYELSESDCFNGESHGVFTGFMLQAMGLTHSDNVFGEVPFFNAQTNGKTHSSLGKTLKVNGTPLSDDKIKNMKLTLNDLYQNGKTYSLFGSYAYQKAVRNNGPCDIILIW